jgi:DNA-binding FadR family transcriptional regulator
MAWLGYSVHWTVPIDIQHPLRMGVGMEITIDRTSREPIYRQIARQIRDLITSAGLPAGFRLPPERRLAQALGVSRSTVLIAYQELRADALIDAHVGRGTMVTPPEAAPARADEEQELPWRQLFGAAVSGFQDPLVGDLLRLTERAAIICASVSRRGVSPSVGL